ncbi:signal transduction histidine kinase [Nocardioides zeae]|uniref:Signal transduction histidine kinase n=1 Tax=Nocardioides zeae TaxID=1457234 RepID=A0ACC6IP14_9ACTN|nr:sensor histidine kinase [Nocardioides zeae]MDR6173392.1 signal transduction histidine kinase [Nocardioides zeae]MDR6212257.1 signal transduction histidine kinase [Nocardioides zeae]
MHAVGGHEVPARWSVGGRLALPAGALAISVVSLYVVSLNGPGPVQVSGMAIVALSATAALLLRRWWLLSASAAALGGGVAVAMTSGEYFSFWPAATALLVLSSADETRGTRRTAPVLACIAGALGAAVAGVFPEAKATLVPIGAATLLVLLIAPARKLVGALSDLDARSRELERQARANEARQRDLQRRSDLARELHDSLGHHVSAIVVQAEAGQVGEAQTSLVAIADLGRQALTELDAVLFDLRDASEVNPPGPPRQPIYLNQIDSALASPLRAGGVQVDVEITTVTEEPDVVTAIYRIAQEALTNVMRHAGARHVSVRVRDVDDHVLVEIEDDGVGLPDELQRRNGLRGIRERAEQLGGHATFSSGHRIGTLVDVRLPRSAR